MKVIIFKIFQQVCERERERIIENFRSLLQKSPIKRRYSAKTPIIGCEQLAVYSGLREREREREIRVWQCVAVCCSMMQCVAG